MRFKSTILFIAGMAMAAGLGTATLAPAGASPAGPAGPNGTVAAMSAPGSGTQEDSLSASGGCGNGDLCVWWDVFSGPSCYWHSGVDMHDWNSYNCGNKVSSIMNNGRTAVDLYWGPGQTGAHACLSAGDTWDLEHDVYRFDYGFPAEGFGDDVNNNIRSHRWVDYCSHTR